MRKQVLITGFSSDDAKILVARCMSDVSKRPIEECRNIIDAITPYGVILLNENSITVEQWEEISTKCTNMMDWHYVEQD